LASEFFDKRIGIASSAYELCRTAGAGLVSIPILGIFAII